MLVSETRVKIEVVVKDRFDYERVIYKGDDKEDAEKAEACLEMCIAIAEIFPNAGSEDVAEIWEVLESNGHTPF